MKTSKNTKPAEYFYQIMKKWFQKTEKTQSIAAEMIGLKQGALNKILRKQGTSLAQMEEIAEKLGYDLIDMLLEGRQVLENNENKRHLVEAKQESLENEKTIEGLRILLSYQDVTAEGLKTIIEKELAKKRNEKEENKNPTNQEIVKSA